VGIVLNLAPVWPEGDGAAAAVEHVDAIQNGIWLGGLIDGAYPDPLRDLQHPELVQDGDLAAIAGSAAWIGINYYTPFRIAAGLGGSERVQSPRAYPGGPLLRFEPRPPMTDMGWEVESRGLEEVLLTTWEKARLPLLVTENGAAYGDAARTADGAVDDDDRIEYLRHHLDATRKAREAGADIRAYLAWTLLDNFEWAEGYTKKFGIVEVEPETLRRIPKKSYRYFAQVAAG
jgi:beta-glucosidase